MKIWKKVEAWLGRFLRLENAARPTLSEEEWDRIAKWRPSLSVERPLADPVAVAAQELTKPSFIERVLGPSVIKCHGYVACSTPNLCKRYGCLSGATND